MSDRATTNPVTNDRIERAAWALAAECGEEDVEDAITRLGYRESAHKALAAAFDGRAPRLAAPSAPTQQPTGEDRKGRP
jgi:hypothetical protein